MVAGMALVSAVTKDGFCAYSQATAVSSAQNKFTALEICHPVSLGTVSRHQGKEAVWPAFDMLLALVHITELEG